MENMVADKIAELEKELEEMGNYDADEEAQWLKMQQRILASVAK